MVKITTGANNRKLQVKPTTNLTLYLKTLLQNRAYLLTPSSTPVTASVTGNKRDEGKQSEEEVRRLEKKIQKALPFGPGSDSESCSSSDPSC